MNENKRTYKILFFEMILFVISYFGGGTVVRINGGSVPESMIYGLIGAISVIYLIRWYHD